MSAPRTREAGKGSSRRRYLGGISGTVAGPPRVSGSGAAGSALQGGPGTPGRWWSLELRFPQALAELGVLLGLGSGAVARLHRVLGCPLELRSEGARLVPAPRAPLGGCTCVCARPRSAPPHPVQPANPSDRCLPAPSWGAVPPPRKLPLGASREAEGAAVGQMLGVFCADPGAWGACSGEDGGRTKRTRPAPVPEPARGGGAARRWKEWRNGHSGATVTR